MRQTALFTKTRRQAPADEAAKNAQLLIRAGFVHKEMAGVYSYLPLGLRTLANIERIIREEMDAIGGQETRMATLHPSEPWKKTGAWDSVDVLFKIQSRTEKEYALGQSEEEIVDPDRCGVRAGHIRTCRSRCTRSAGRSTATSCARSPASCADASSA